MKFDIPRMRYPSARRSVCRCLKLQRRLERIIRVVDTSRLPATSGKDTKLERAHGIMLCIIYDINLELHCSIKLEISHTDHGRSARQTRELAGHPQSCAGAQRARSSSWLSIKELTRVHRERLPGARVHRSGDRRAGIWQAAPAEPPGSTTAWYAHLDEFVAAYATSRFGSSLAGRRGGVSAAPLRRDGRDPTVADPLP